MRSVALLVGTSLLAVATERAPGDAAAGGYRPLGIQVSVTGTWLGAVDAGNPAAPGNRLGIAGAGIELGARQIFGRREDGTPATMLAHSFDAERIRFDYDLAPGVAPVTTFTTLSYRLLVRHRFADSGWSAGATLGIGLGVDRLADAKLDDLDLTGGPQVSYRFDNGLELGVGLVYQELFGEPGLLPFPFLRYRSRDGRHRAGLLGPRARYAYRVAPAHILGLEVGLEGYDLHILSRRYADHAADGTRIASARAVSLAYRGVVAGPSYRWQPAPFAWASLRAGWAFARRFAFAHRDDADRELRLADGTAVDFDPEDTWRLALQLGARF